MTTPKRSPQPKRPRRVPQRTCIICRTVQGKRQLHRIVRLAAPKTDPAETAPSLPGVVYDPTGKAAGRGAYLCSNPTCWRQALDRGALARALKITLTEADRAALTAIGQQLANETTPDETVLPPTSPSTPSPA